VRDLRRVKDEGAHLKSIEDVLKAQAVLLLTTTKRTSASTLTRLISSVAEPSVELASGKEERRSAVRPGMIAERRKRTERKPARRPSS
jgi:hypothetical protein